MRDEPTPPPPTPLKTTLQLLTAIVDQYVRALQLSIETHLADHPDSTPSFYHFERMDTQREGGQRHGEGLQDVKRPHLQQKKEDVNMRGEVLRVNIRHNQASDHNLIRQTSFEECLHEDSHPKKATHQPHRPQIHPQFGNNHPNNSKHASHHPITPHSHPQHSKTSLSDCKSNLFKLHIPTIGYDQYKDKTLVQYFYTKKKHLFDLDHKIETCSHQNDHNNSSHRVETQRNNFVSSRNEKKYDFKKLIHIAEGKNFEVRAQAGRRAQFNSYDLISCQRSIKRGTNTGTRLPSQSQQNSIKDGTFSHPPSELLKTRMIRLQSKIYSKMPCLVEMGVKFRRVKRKR